ncbi:MAG: S49 family peptidase, partial [Gammaproteobacteria bacterium]
YEDIKAIAGGRVWIATSAKELGLIDGIGGIEEAIAYAAEMAALDDHVVKYYQKKLTQEELILKQIFKNFDVKVQEPAALVMFTGLTEIYKTLIDIKNPQVLLTCELCLVDID